MKNTQIILTVGSDTSFDLIVEVLDQAAEEKPIAVIAYPAELKELADAYFHKIQPTLLSIVSSVSNQFVIKVFNKIPDEFVWIGRMEAAVAELNKVKGLP